MEHKDRNDRVNCRIKSGNDSVNCRIKSRNDSVNCRAEVRDSRLDCEAESMNYRAENIDKSDGDREALRDITVGDVAALLEKDIPLAAACDWDNVGLLLGRRDKRVRLIYVCLDAGSRELAAALDCGADLVIAHHPIIFKAIKRINSDDAAGRKLLMALRADLAVYCLHTNYDSSPGGMGEQVCARMGLKKCAVLEPQPPVPGCEAAEAGFGIGFVAELPRMMSGAELSRQLSAQFGLPAVELYDAGRPIHRIACCPGSGRSMQRAVLASGADAFISGDLGHHEGLDLVEAGVSALNAGHYGLEHIFMEDMAGRLSALAGVSLTVAKLNWPSRFYTERSDGR